MTVTVALQFPSASAAHELADWLADEYPAHQAERGADQIVDAIRAQIPQPTHDHDPGGCICGCPHPDCRGGCGGQWT